MAELRKIETPEHLMNIPEFAEVDRILDKQALQIEIALENLENDIHISTSTRKGIERREKILGIIPKDAVNIERRRANVMIAWFDVYPYTNLDLKRRLDILCGTGRCKVDYDSANQNMKIYFDLRAKNLVEDAQSMLEKIVPLMISISTEIIYNKWQIYRPWNWRNMKARKWNYIKEGFED